LEYPGGERSHIKESETALPQVRRIRIARSIHSRKEAIRAIMSTNITQLGYTLLNMGTTVYDEWEVKLITTEM